MKCSASITIAAVNDGVSVSSIVREYAKSTSDTTAPSSGWSHSMPSRNAGEHLWVRDKITYSDGSSGYTSAYVASGIQGSGFFRTNTSLTTSSTTVARSEVMPVGRPIFQSDSIVDKSGLVFAVTADAPANATSVRIQYRYSIKGEDGDDNSACVLVFAPGSPSCFSIPWTGNVADQAVTVRAETLQSASSLQWGTSAGTLDTVSGDVYARSLRLSTVSGNEVDELDSILLSVTTDRATITLPVSIFREEMPSPIYCGTVDLSAGTPPNPARQEGMYAQGDYVLHSGNSDEDYVYGNIYEWDGKTWQMSNTAEHTFGALEDLVASVSKGSSTSPFQIIRNLIASSIVSESLSVRNANITEKLTVDKISGKDGDGVGFELTRDGISATKKDDEGKIVSAWEFRSDGTGSIINLDVSGDLTANAINHEALVTQAATTFGASGQKSYSKVFQKDLWSRSKMYQRITPSIALSSPEMRIMTTVNGASYDGKAISKIGFASASLIADNTISDTAAETAGSLEFGTYTRSYGVAAGSRHEKLAKKTNNFGFPVYVDASWSLTGNWNWQEMYIYGSDGKETYSNNSEDNGTYHNCFILPPGYSLKISAGSSAWFGNRTATFTVKVTPCPIVPYISEGALNDVTGTAGSNIAGMQHWDIGTAAIPSAARYIAFFYCQNGKPCRVFRMTSGSTTFSITLSDAKTLYPNGPIYAEIPESLRGMTVTVSAGAERESYYDSDDGTTKYRDYKCYMKMVHYALFSFIPNNRNSILLEYSDGTIGRIDASYGIADYRDWDISRFVYASWDSASYLEKISGSSVCSWLDSQGFSSGAQFSTNSGEESSLTVNADSYSSSNGKRPINIQKTTNGYQVICNGSNVNIYRLNGAVSASLGFYDALSLLFYPLVSESKILTRHISPQQNETFDLGEDDKRYRKVFCKEGFFTKVWGAVAN